MKIRVKNFLLGIIPFLVIGLIWYIASYLSIIPTWMIPSPLKTIQTFFNLIIDGTLVKLSLISIKNTLVGFAVATICALILGVLIGMYPIFRKIFFPFFSAVYVVPSLAWLPLIILLLGFTTTTVLCIIVLSSFKKIVYNVVSGVRNVQDSWLLAAKNAGLNQYEIMYKVVLPGALPHIITGLRMGFGSAWRSLIGAEMLVAGTTGLGKFIWTAQWFFDFDKVFAGILVIALVGLLVEQFVFKQIEDKILVKWGLVRGES